MRIVFVSNYFNHHQEALAKALYNTEGVEFSFIETEEMEEERKQLGWQQISENALPFIYSTLNRKEHTKCKELIENADVIIWGSAPKKIVKKHLLKGKPTFLYTERLYKKPYPSFKLFIRKIKMHCIYGRHSSLYILAASAFVASDFAKTHTLNGKVYKWGYFPELKCYKDIGKLISEKKENSILWVARFIDLKHPEKVIEVAKRLRESNYNFNINMIGVGELTDYIGKIIAENNLTDYVHILGVMPPQKVREEMEKSRIFLFTSDRNEGWGAVLNEAMNSACAVVASHSIGSVPFLIKDKENGIVYKNDDIEDLAEKVKWLLDNKSEAEKIGERAYYTLVDEWNAENAANKFLKLTKLILESGEDPDIYEDGVCRKAESLDDDWYLS